MPTYEFHCEECGYYFEFLASISEKERKENEHSIACEQCGSTHVDQVFGGFSILTGKSVRPPSGGGGCDPSMGCC